ncbi:MAG: hypothetical protein EA402_08470 [Planctomycetota bacterium]|nr:MAG: hypothetical protein EA402_08470 [Planctomycetota bacterium]
MLDSEVPRLPSIEAIRPSGAGVVASPIAWRVVLSCLILVAAWPLGACRYVGPGSGIRTPPVQLESWEWEMRQAI